ncbi:leucyl aminopeptidase [Angomonas deanei]|uniref:Cytosol aminopeptidase family, catalytic domain containing protein, putative n=1 Tax=Angomonas deanei TaxID=59799 RepID=A0A7G2CP38_9TRYP|nr:leucyl aminopeptidase [Angomonas deanei]CAD2220714.1 Cytosol aminopeptidase family, catalytic domain containing protein, putative [Angomonas deanei]|eukprot:EPY24714.1 leucyl aminopeptidase [Angomonas deanei]
MLRRVQARAAFAPSVAVTAFGAHQANGMFKKQKNAIQKHNKHVRVQFVTATEVKEHANNKKKSVGEDLTVPAPNPYTVVTPASYPTGFRGTAGEVSVREAPKSPVTVFSGLGSRGQITDYRQAVTAAVRQGKKLGATHAVLHPPTTPITTCDGLWTAPSVLSPAKVAEKTALYGVTAAYQYDRLVTKAIDGSNHNQTKSTREIKASSKKQPKRDFSIAVASSETAAVKRGTAIGRCITDCRNLGNLREDEGVPLYYKEWIQRNVARLPGVRVRTVLVGDQLRRAGLNLLHSVGKGSRHPPCMMVLEYIGDKRSKESLALVGKGVTFDCGGLNVKPYGAMETMHTDMMGAATAVTTLKCVAELGLKVNVSCTVGFVENAIGPDSYHPSTIIKSLKGLEVEVTNTDAEGRLILADMLTYVQNYARLRLAPTRIIDLATLTGAIIISLGNHRAGLFSNQTELSTALYQSGCHTGELVWPMPVGEEHAQLMRRKMADLVNAAPGRAGVAAPLPPSCSTLSTTTGPGRTLILRGWRTTGRRSARRTLLGSPASVSSCSWTF